MQKVNPYNCDACKDYPCKAIKECSGTMGNNKPLENVFRNAYKELIARVGCRACVRKEE